MVLDRAAPQSPGQLSSMDILDKAEHTGFLQVMKYVATSDRMKVRVS